MGRLLSFARGTRARRLLLVLALILGAAAVYVGVKAVRLAGQSAVAANAALDVEYLAMAGKLDSLGDLQADFAVDDSANVLLVPRSGGLAILDVERNLTNEEVGGRVFDSAAFDGDTILGTSMGFFGRLGPGGAFEEGLPLPYNAARLTASASPGAVYLFGELAGEWRLYRFREKGDYEIVLASVEEIVGVADGSDGIWVATPRRILRLDRSGLHNIFVAPANPEFGTIAGIALTDEGDPVFSTDRAVWIANGRGEADTLINDAGGTLRARGGKFYLLDRRRKLLLRFSERGRETG